MDLFDDEVVTTADKIDRPQSSLDREMFEDFNERNPMAGGGRINFYKGMSAKKAPQKFKLEKEKTSSGFAGDRKLTQDQIDSLDPDYLGKINIEDAENKSREKNVKVYKSGATKYGSVLDDAIEIRNVIINNKGNIFGLEELGEKAGIFGQGSRKSGKVTDQILEE